MSEMLIVTANASIAKIFSSNSLKGENFKIVEKLEHPESRLKGADLATDGSGDFHPPGVTLGIHAPHSSPKEDEWNKFAKIVADYIDKHQKQYKNIVICAAPHFEGLLNKYIDKELEEKIVKRINKDYTKLNNEELIDVIKDNISWREVSHESS